MTRFSWRNAFTLVELLVVVAILSVLATIGFFSLRSYASNARDSVRLSDMATIERGLWLAAITKGWYPIPDNATTFVGNTGSFVLQGVFGNRTSLAIDTKIGIKDPRSGAPYVYSIFGNGQYYQIAGVLENTQSDDNGVVPYSSLVKWDYRMDPSLPSLIVVPESAVATSSVFDPNVCFITNNGPNIVTSNQVNCVKKKDTILKNLDTSIVGYWDMETVFGSGAATYMKDLSGNGNEGIISGGVIAATGSLNGARNFNGTTGLITMSGSDGMSFDFNQNFSISILLKIPPSQNDTSNPWYYNTILEKWLFGSPYSYSFIIRNQLHPTETGKLFGLRWDGANNPSAVTSARMDDATFHTVVLTKNWNALTQFIDWKKDSTGVDTTSNTISKNTPLVIWWGNFSQTKFTGTIDEVKIYNRNLSDEEIRQQAKIAGF